MCNSSKQSFSESWYQISRHMSNAIVNELDNVGLCKDIESCILAFIRCTKCETMYNNTGTCWCWYINIPDGPISIITRDDGTIELYVEVADG